MSLAQSSFYLLNDGTVKTCGYNNHGQLGLGDITDKNTPTLISSLNNVKQISCGYRHTLFVLSDGTVMACGANNFGQLGLGDTTYRLTPTLISGLNNVKQIACGNYHTLFLLNDGTVKVCGANNFGQLGMGDTVDRLTPTLITDLNNVKQIDCGYDYTVFLLNDGTVKVCGFNNSGQLGMGGTTNKNTPTLIPSLNNVKQIACGYDHTLFLLNDGTVKACGANNFGQLGMSGYSNVLTPTLISGLNNVDKIDCGYDIVEIIKLLLKSNNKYYSILDNNYDTSTKMYKELSVTDINKDLVTHGFDLDYLLKDVTINGETFKPIDKFSKFSIVSSKEGTYVINGIKNNKELIISNQNLSTVSSVDIHNFIFDINKINNGDIKFVISNDNGITWKTWNGTDWVSLTNTSPLDDDNKVKQYSQLSKSEKTQWNKLKDEIWNSGMETDITGVDYNAILTNKHIRFAFVLYRPNYNDNIFLKNTQWLYDKIGPYHKLSDADIDITITHNSCIVTPKLKNLENVKVNILI